MDEGWLEAFASGDHHAFSQLVHARAGDVFRWVRPFADGVDEAEDLCQEVWRRVFRARSSLRSQAAVGAWLHAVARSVCLDHVRKQEAAKRLVASVAADAARDPEERANPLELVASREGRRRIQRVLMALPDRQREVVLHRIFSGLSTRETARAMGCAEGTVKASLSQAFSRIRDKLIGEIVDEY